MSFPNKLLRGISAENQIVDDGYASAVLFYFEERKNQEQREDNYFEESISWRDDKGADDIIFNQKKNDGNVQFKFGAALVCRSELDRIIVTPLVNRQLSYERKELADNPYHGNLLMSRNVSKRVRKQIAATIATMCVREIIQNPNAA